MHNRLFRRLPQNQRGITGLETAIILIAFVVVASVFAYTVLSAGIFSSEKGKEAIFSGLESARSSMELVGNVKAIADTAVTIDTGEAMWTTDTTFATNGGTVTTDTTDRREGTASGEMLWADAHNSGLMVYNAVSPTVDLSPHYTIRLWVQSSLALAAGDLQVVLDNDSAICASPEETLDVPALTADTWTRVIIKMSAPSGVNSVACVGLKAGADVTGATTVNWDLIESPGEVDQIVFVVSNALEGEAIDLTTTIDTANPTLGILSDETSENTKHVLVIDYVDADERLSDLAWTTIQRGLGDGDSLLEPGEKFEIIVELRALNSLPVERTKFALHLRPRSGSAITIEKTIPGTIDAIMDLK